MSNPTFAEAVSDWVDTVISADYRARTYEVDAEIKPGVGKLRSVKLTCNVLLTREEADLLAATVRKQRMCDDD